MCINTSHSNNGNVSFKASATVTGREQEAIPEADGREKTTTSSAKGSGYHQLVQQDLSYGHFMTSANDHPTNCIF